MKNKAIVPILMLYSIEFTWEVLITILSCLNINVIIFVLGDKVILLNT